MPVYNAGRFIRDAVTSILAQSFTDFELIIVDDGSSDDSLSIVNSFGDSRIKLLKNGSNMGVVYTRNRGLTETTGEYYAPFDADDVALPDKFRRQVGFLQSHPDFGMVGSWARTIDEKGNILAKRWKLTAKPEEVPAILLFRNYFVQSAVVIRRRDVPEGGYREGFDIGEDYRMWIEIAGKVKTWNLPEYLLFYRFHQDSTTAGSKHGIQYYDSLVYRDLYKKLGIDLTPARAELLQLVKGDKISIDRASLSDIEQFLQLILNQNLIHHQYDQKQLMKVILNRWMKVCLQPGRVNISSVAAFMGSGLLKNYLFLQP